jgi:HEAT repeat protein
MGAEPMRAITVLALLSLGLFQDPKTRDLIEQLNSDKIADREAAERKLKAMGRAAASELKNALNANEPEIAIRAKRLLRILEVRETLPAELLTQFPGVEDRLAAEPHEWTVLFFRVREEVTKNKPRPPLPVLGRRHLEALAAEAFRGASTPEEGQQVGASILKFNLRSAIPAIVARLRSADWRDRNSACVLLGEMACPEVSSEMLPLLKDPRCSSAVVNAFAILRPWRLDPAIVELLSDKDEVARGTAATIAGQRRLRQAIPKLRALLQDPEPDVRAAAIRALDELEDRGHLAALVALLQDPSESVRRQAAGSLAKGNEPEVGQIALGWIRNPAQEARQLHLSWGVTTVGRLKMKEAVPDLIRLLQGPELKGEGRLVDSTATALGQIGDDAAIEALQTMLRDSKAPFRRHGLYAVARFRLRSLLSDVEPLLKDPNAEIRRLAVSELPVLTEKPAIEKIAPLLQDPEASVRSQAMVSLVRLGAREEGKGVLKLLKDPDRGVRGTARGFIARLKPEGSLEALLGVMGEDVFEASEVLVELGAEKKLDAIRPFLKDARIKARRDGAALVGLLKDRESIPALKELLQDRAPEVRLEACKALIRLQAEGWVEPLGQLLASEPTRVEALKVLGLAGPEALPLLETLIVEPKDWLRQRLVMNLVQAGGKKAIPVLLRLLDDPYEEIRSAAQRSLLDLDVATLPEILRVLERRGDDDWSFLSRPAALHGLHEPMAEILRRSVDSNPWYRANALESAAQVRARAALPEIRSALNAEHPLVIAAAAGALGGLEDRESLPALRALLRHTDQEVRLAAARAVCAMGEREGARILVEEDALRLFVLNRLRQPAMWKKLSETALRESIEGFGRPIFERWSALAGVPADLPAPPADPAKEYLNVYCRWPARNGRASALDGLAEEEVSIILEADRVRAVSPKEARLFWRDWWESEGRK